MPPVEADSLRQLLIAKPRNRASPQTESFADQQQVLTDMPRFQKNHKLEQDGLVGPKTAKAINKELKQQAAANA